jgi:alpha-amylase
MYIDLPDALLPVTTRYPLSPLTLPLMQKHLARFMAALFLTCTANAAGGAAPKPQSSGTQTVDVSMIAAKKSPSRLPRDWHRGAFMEIFVRAYQDSDGDGIGDLRGLASRLDYLQELGIRGIWLMPIQKNADGDHGYATVDFRAVAPEYGTLDDFDYLLREAEKRGIGIIIDYVVNHSAASHPWFLEARSNTNSPKRDWYVFSPKGPPDMAIWDIWGKNPWYWVGAVPWNFKGEVKDMPRPPGGASDFYFGTFGPHMPDFNLRNPAVVNYHISSLRYWLNRGLAGYRLDAVPHLIENNGVDWNDQPQSRALTKRLADAIHAYPNRYVVCEATQKPEDYGDNKVCGGAFAFGYTHQFVKAAKGDAAAVRALADYYRQASANMATFISNHDIFAGQRLWDQVNGDVAQYKLAAAAYLLQPGTPFIYYGEEIGQAGVGELKGDMPLRSPMSWNANGGFTTGAPFRPLAPNIASNNVDVQRADPNSIFNFYKSMIALRNAHASIARGSYEHAFANGMVLGFQRALGRERKLVLINYGTEVANIDAIGLKKSQTLSLIYPASVRMVTHPAWDRIAIPTQSVLVFDVK